MCKRNRIEVNNYTSRLQSTWALAAICAGSAVLTSSSTAFAQVDRSNYEHVGYPHCFHAPKSVPGLSGAPVWPTYGLAPDYDGDERPDVADPRWSNDPLRSFRKGEQAGPTDNALYRVLTNTADGKNELIVSIQVNSDTSITTKDDYVWFGISTETTDDPTEGRAWAIKIPASTKPSGMSDLGNYMQPVEDEVIWFRFDGNPKVWPSDIGWPDAGDAFVVQESAAVWNKPATDDGHLNGAQWAVQFKVDLNQLNLSPFEADQKLRFTIGAHVASGVGVTTYENLNRELCEAAGSCPPFQEGFLHGNPNEWTELDTLDGACEGTVDLKWNHIKMANQDASSNALPESAVLRSADAWNHFTVAPEGAETLLTGIMEAQFRMSDWGSIADEEAGWINIGGPQQAEGQPGDADAGLFKYDCQNAGAAPNVCNVVFNVGVGEASWFHQCLQVALRPTTGNEHEVSFTNATSYRNTRFQELSDLDEVATINVQGLQAKLGNQNDRDVYLHVVTTNMPAAGPDILPAMDLPALSALRQQVAGGSTAMGTCADTGSACVDLNAGVSVCGHECEVTSGETTCGRLETKHQTKTGCFCLPYDVVTVGPAEYEYEYEECGATPPAGGGVNFDVSSLDGPQKLAAEFPTYMVYPYYDSGKTETIDGVDYPRLVAMPSFGFHVYHEGDYYGFLHGLANEDGSALDEVAPNYFRITVPNESKARLRVLISAEERPHYAPFSEVAGFGRTWGWGMGRVQLTGVSAADTVVDLSAATVTLTSVLKDGATELVSNMPAPVVLTPTSSSTASSAMFVSSGSSPKMVVTVLSLPVIGYVTSIAVSSANVGRPASCGWFGSATLTTEFSIDNGDGSKFAVRGDDQWTCTPFALWNW